MPLRIGRLRRCSSQKKKRRSDLSLTASTLIDIWRRFDEDGMLDTSCFS